MVEIEIAYRGELGCVAKHGPSAQTLFTDAPVDNKGKGQAFSPTDLVATALGTCMLTLMGIRAEERSWSIEGAGVVVRKHMTTTLPRRIEKLDVSVRVPTGASLSAEARSVLEQAANTSPVRLSILAAIEVPVSFEWGTAR